MAEEIRKLGKSELNQRSQLSSQKLALLRGIVQQTEWAISTDKGK